MGTPKLTRYTMNTFHLASLALLVGLISAAPTSTYPHVDAVVPEIEVQEDNHVYNLVTFTINPLKRLKFEAWMRRVASMSYICEKGTVNYMLYKGHWQVEQDAPNVPDPENTAPSRSLVHMSTEEYDENNNLIHDPTYTIFEGFASDEARKKHEINTEGTATQRNEFGPANPEKPGEKPHLTLIVSHPTTKEFDYLAKDGASEGKVILDYQVGSYYKKDIQSAACDKYPHKAPLKAEANKILHPNSEKVAPTTNGGAQEGTHTTFEPPPLFIPHPDPPPTVFRRTPRVTGKKNR